MNRRVLALLPLAGAAAGCTVLLSPGEDQCEAAADCEARGFEGASCVDGVCVSAAADDPIWGCLGHVTEPTADPTQHVDVSVRLVFANGGAALTSGTVDVCDKLDIDCANMDPDFPKGLTPDGMGNISVSVRQGFEGFVRISDPQIVDSRIYVGRPIVTVPKIKEIRLLRPDEYTDLAAVFGAQIDETRGTAILLGVDCKGDGAYGVRFESPNAEDGTAREFYLINKSPAVPPAATFTDVDGFGGFFDLAAGSNVARTFRAADDTYIGESSFLVLGNTISYVQIAPTPQ